MSLLRMGRDVWRIQLELDAVKDAETGRVKRQRKYETYHGTKKQAEARERALRLEIETGLPMDAGELTVADWLTRWLDRHASLAVRESTMLRYRAMATRWASLVGQHRLQRLTTEHLQTAVRAMVADGTKPSTLRNYRNLMHAALTQAAAQGYIQRNPVEAVTFPRLGGRTGRALEPRELTRLIESIEDADFRALVEVTVGTGMRLGEITGLQWSAVDLDGARVRVERQAIYRAGQGVIFGPPKTEDSRREISLAGVTLAVLRAHRTRQLEARLEAGDLWMDGGLVFPDPLGRPLAPYVVGYRFREVATAAGFPGLRFHDLRHTSATLLLRGGVSDKLAAQRLGHTSPRTTQALYQHVHRDLADGVAALLEAAMQSDTRPA